MAASCKETLQTKDALKAIIADSKDLAREAALAVVASEKGPADSGADTEDDDAVLKRKFQIQGEDAAAAAIPEAGDGGKRHKGSGNPESAKQKVGYTKEEAQDFNQEIRAIGRDDFRITCAADDVLTCLNYVINAEFTEGEREVSMEAIARAKGLALSLFVEFLLAGEVSVNGKKFRVYSGLRPELQNIVRMAKSKLARDGSGKDPVALAKELTEELINAPVSMLIESDDDGHSRIAEYLRKNPEQVAQIRRFVENSLDLPLGMHEAVINALRLGVGKTMQLVDYLSVVFNEIEAKLPAFWASFATDVCNYFAASSGFAAGCDQASLMDWLPF